MKQTNFNYYFARFMVTLRDKGTLVVDIHENFESREDAMLWLRIKENNATALSFGDSNKYYTKSDCTAQTISYFQKTEVTEE